MTKSKILMVNLTNIGQGEGGAIHQLALASRFIERGHRVRMLAPKRAENDQVPDHLSEIAHFTVSFARWGMPRSIDGLLQIPYVLSARLRGFNVLYIRANLFTFVTILFARLFGMRVLSEHNSWSASERKGRGGGRMMTRFEHLAQAWAGKLSFKSRAVTQGIADMLIQNGVASDRVIAIGNGCDINDFTPRPKSDACAAIGMRDDVFRLGFIGGLVAWQGVETAIRSLRHLPQTDAAGRSIELAIIGDGPERGSLEQLCATLYLSDRVRFVGYLPRQQACDAIGSFDIALAPFTFARNAEIGLSPIKIRDYAACGRPVVVSAIAGITELAEHGWLYCHAPDDDADLAKVLLPLINDERTREQAGVAARQFAEEHFDWRVIADRVAVSLIEAKN